MRKRLVIGNWKMNGSLAANQVLLSDLVNGLTKTSNCLVAVCPSFPYLAQVQSCLQNSVVSWGAQDISIAESGAYTGEVSANMLKDFACRWVIVGHSERRTYHGERSEVVAQKALRAVEHGITPVVCVGESLANREAGQTLAVIEEQLAPVLALDSSVVSQIVVAYEPVWAIGTGLTATPAQAQEVHAFIRTQLATVGAADVQILYGGSVKADNAANLFTMPDIDGALVGGAALNAKEFLAIIAA
ncbi:triose-phosphate isomerase [Pelistega europaea]|uniref:Triosephosphate isomerase n=1 Tax=Pelistega europaea TaxID=106147 RepID=A0A7Y4LAC4_9BURK|nr:triose-phosphate isomerase [Pelistega europaea]NOL49854.1 triose-phosphate isomerase [Pelistega europaea]